VLEVADLIAFLLSPRGASITGAEYVIDGRSPDRLILASFSIAYCGGVSEGDAGNLADLDRLYDTVRAEKGHIDILYASAGVGDFNVPLGSHQGRNPESLQGRPARSVYDEQGRGQRRSSRVH
jgi:NAD(P)-dependent dehydrogenase (short-subunit alcohol dehydrogenase family)